MNSVPARYHCRKRGTKGASAGRQMGARVGNVTQTKLVTYDLARLTDVATLERYANQNNHA
jgi:hypothetical protein